MVLCFSNNQRSVGRLTAVWRGCRKTLLCIAMPGDLLIGMMPQCVWRLSCCSRGSWRWVLCQRSSMMCVLKDIWPPQAAKSRQCAVPHWQGVLTLFGTPSGGETGTSAEAVTLRLAWPSLHTPHGASTSCCSPLLFPSCEQGLMTMLFGHLGVSHMFMWMYVGLYSIYRSHCLST